MTCVSAPLYYRHSIADRMKMLCVCVFLLASVLLVRGEGGINSCEKKSACSCDTFLGDIDLSGIDGGEQPRFRDIDGPSGLTFSWNPCSSFTEGSCQNVAVCAVSKTASPKYTSLGSQQSATFSVKDDDLQITYTAGRNKTTITLTCDDTSRPGELTYDGEMPAGSGHYQLTLRSAHACLQSATAVTIHTMSPKPVTFAPVNYHYDFSKMENLLSGLVAISFFVLLLLTVFVGLHVYRVCKGGAGSGKSYDNL